MNDIFYFIFVQIYCGWSSIEPALEELLVLAGGEPVTVEAWKDMTAAYPNKHKTFV